MEVEKEDIEGDEGEEGDVGEEKTKEKGKEVVYISNENEVLSIRVLLKKKETIESIVQNNVWEYQDKAIGMDTIVDRDEKPEIDLWIGCAKNQFSHFGKTSSHQVMFLHRYNPHVIGDGVFLSFTT